MTSKVLLTSVTINAVTIIYTSFEDCIVADVISLRSRMRELGSYDDEADFKQSLYTKIRNKLDTQIKISNTKLLLVFKLKKSISS